MLHFLNFLHCFAHHKLSGMRIGPEPTTDGFAAVMENEERQEGASVNVIDSLIPGNTLVLDRTKPFKGLAAFGNSFLQKFQCAQMQHPTLENITFIDTPGILAGMGKSQRGYDYTKASKVVVDLLHAATK